MKSARWKFEMGEIHSLLCDVANDAWQEWLKEKEKDGFNLHLYRGEDTLEGEGSMIQFNDFNEEFVYCVTLDDVIKSAIDCNDGKADLNAMAQDLQDASDKLFKAAAATRSASKSTASTD